jgi:hypothetical protein
MYSKDNIFQSDVYIIITIITSQVTIITSQVLAQVPLMIDIK